MSASATLFGSGTEPVASVQRVTRIIEGNTKDANDIAHVSGVLNRTVKSVKGVVVDSFAMVSSDYSASLFRWSARLSTDPMVAAEEANKSLEIVVSFLKRLGGVVVDKPTTMQEAVAKTALQEAARP